VPHGPSEAPNARFVNGIRECVTLHARCLLVAHVPWLRRRRGKSASRHTGGVVDYLVTPTEEGPWRVDVLALVDWLATWWPDGRASAGQGERATLWEWPDGHEVWVPEGREVLWLAADLPRIAAVASWCTATATVPLILTDEGYNETIDLAGASEQELLEILSE
jgi:hypothetical protein